MFWWLGKATLWDTMEEARHNHDEALIQLLVQARKANIKFNKDKMQLHMSELLYIGHWISGEGVRPDPSKVLAIQNMATPKSASETFDRGNVEFAWGPDEQAAFSNIKDPISSDQLLAFYDVKKPVVIQCDASTEGLYCRKADPTKVETDHKPLEVITKKSLLSAPRRLQRMLLALQTYDLDVIHKSGEQQVIADTLSRLPAEQPQAEELSPQEIFQIASMQEEAQELEG
ncbi:hypothetical protein EMCRGX_G004004 [Ephydatia muelleri]